MIGVVVLLLAFPLGYLVRSRLTANTAYAIAYLWAFVFQTLYLQLDPELFPEGEFPLGYGVVAAAVFALGFGLVAVGFEVRRRRTSRSATTVAA